MAGPEHVKHVEGQAIREGASRMALSLSKGIFPHDVLLKRWSRAKKLALINGNPTELKGLAQCHSTRPFRD
jgi:hypothetical protein